MPAPSALGDLSIGLNLSEASFLQTVDLFRQAPGFVLRDASGRVNEAATEALVSDDGSPGAAAPAGLTWHNDFGYSRDLRPGAYELTWQGDANVVVGGRAGVTVLETRDNTVVIEVAARPEGSISPQGFTLDVAAGSDAPSDFSLVYQDDKPLLEAGYSWQPDFVDKVAEAGIVRTMKLQGTINSDVVDWDAAAESLAKADWAERVPLEAIVELANDAGADVWFNIPHGASDAYVAAAAAYLRDNLSADLDVTVEYSNEHWIGGTNYDYWVRESGELFYDGAPPSDRSEFLDAAEFYAIRATRTADIFTDVFETGPNGRDATAVLTAASFLEGENAFERDYLERLWDAPRAAELGLASPNASGVFDAIATDAYFEPGLAKANGVGYRANLEGVKRVFEEEGAEAAADAYFRFATREADQGYRFEDARQSYAIDGTTLAERAANFAAWGEFAQARGLDYFAYEGGTSVVWSQRPNEEAFGLFLDGLNEDPRMTALGNRVVEDFHAAGGDLYMHFADLGDNGSFGNWSSYTSVFADDPTARGETYTRYNAAEPKAAGLQSWGTRGDDVLQGGRGDDDFNGGLGNDILHGGRGDDLLRGLLGDDILHGGSGDDVLDGQNDSDTLYGGAGNDSIEGNWGDDTLYGGRGGDVFLFKAWSGHDVVMDFEAGIDRIDVSAFGWTLSQAAANLRTDADTGDAILDIPGNLASVTFAGVDVQTLTDADTWIV